jgi:hypothetical protein
MEDGSKFTKVELTVLQDLSPGHDIRVIIPETVDLIIPIEGVYGINAPRIAITSLTNPMSTYSFKSYTPVGSFSPSSIALTIGQNLSVDALSISLKVRCPLVKSDIVEIFLPNLDFRAVENITQSSHNISQFTSYWNSSSKMLFLEVYSGVVTGKVNLTFKRFLRRFA